MASETKNLLFEIHAVFWISSKNLIECFVSFELKNLNFICGADNFIPKVLIRIPNWNPNWRTTAIGQILNSENKLLRKELLRLVFGLNANFCSGLCCALLVGIQTVRVRHLRTSTVLRRIRFVRRKSHWDANQLEGNCLRTEKNFRK